MYRGNDDCSGSEVSGESDCIDFCISEETTIDQLLGDRNPDEICVGEYSLLKFTESEELAVYTAFKGDDMIGDLFCQNGHYYVLSKENDDSEEVLTLGDFLKKIK